MAYLTAISGSAFGNIRRSERSRDPFGHVGPDKRMRYRRGKSEGQRDETTEKTGAESRTHGGQRIRKAEEAHRCATIRCGPWKGHADARLVRQHVDLQMPQRAVVAPLQEEEQRHGG